MHRVGSVHDETASPDASPLCLTAPFRRCRTTVQRSCRTSRIAPVVASTAFVVVQRKIDVRMAAVLESVPNIDVTGVGSPVLVERRRGQTRRRVGLAESIFDELMSFQPTLMSATRLAVVVARSTLSTCSGTDARGSGRNGFCRGKFRFGCQISGRISSRWRRRGQRFSRCSSGLLRHRQRFSSRRRSQLGRGSRVSDRFSVEFNDIRRGRGDGFFDDFGSLSEIDFGQQGIKVVACLQLTGNRDRAGSDRGECESAEQIAFTHEKHPCDLVEGRRSACHPPRCRRSIHASAVLSL